MVNNLNIERKSRMILGALALIAILIFFLTTFGVSNASLIGMVATGILISLLLFTESGIVSYVKNSKWKTFTFGDMAVYLGVLAGASLLVFSISLIPSIGETLPVSIINFTTNFARIIAGIALAVVLIFIITPKFE